MTRKRFVKLLMAKGYSRNSANDLAVAMLERGLDYGSAYTAATVYALTIIVDVCPEVVEIAFEYSEPQSRVLRAFCDGVDALIEDYTNTVKTVEEETVC